MTHKNIRSRQLNRLVFDDFLAECQTIEALVGN